MFQFPSHQTWSLTCWTWCPFKRKIAQTRTPPSGSMVIGGRVLALGKCSKIQGKQNLPELVEWWRMCGTFTCSSARWGSYDRKDSIPERSEKSKICSESLPRMRGVFVKPRASLVGLVLLLEPRASLFLFFVSSVFIFLLFIFIVFFFSRSNVSFSSIESAYAACAHH